MIDELCAIAITADNSTVNGNYEITMEDIKFMLPNSYAYIPESVPTATLTIVGGQNPSGINDAAADSQAAKYYDLSGREVLNPKNGLYISGHEKVVIK